MNTGLDKTLKERGKNYGSYIGGVRLRVDIMSLIKNRHRSANKIEMNPIYEDMISDIVNKLTRLAVTPTHADSWHDIQGYSKLITNYLEGVPNADK